MYIKSLLLAMGLLTVAGCAGNVTVPPLGLDHPANPQAAAASPSRLLALDANPAPAQKRHSAMDHSSMSGMNMGEMNHSGMSEMQTSGSHMDHPRAMKSMDHGMEHMHHSNPMKDMQGMKGVHEIKGMEGMPANHSHEGGHVR